MRTIKFRRKPDMEKEIVDKLIALTEDVVNLKLENERLKVELKYERELNKHLKGSVNADTHSNAIDFTYLQNWYQDSIDEEKEPIWTDKHLEELFNDFYLIPK